MVDRPRLALLGAHEIRRADDLARSASVDASSPKAGLASPKSATLIVPSSARNKLAGLMSRCTSPDGVGGGQSAAGVGRDSRGLERAMAPVAFRARRRRCRR